MNYDEVKERIEYIIAFNVLTRADKNALKFGIKAVENQIPKNPINIRGAYFGKGKGGNCPNCKVGVNSIEYKYCRCCGQSLDWSDVK